MGTYRENEDQHVCHSVVWCIFPVSCCVSISVLMLALIYMIILPACLKTSTIETYYICTRHLWRKYVYRMNTWPLYFQLLYIKRPHYWEHWGSTLFLLTLSLPVATLNKCLNIKMLKINDDFCKKILMKHATNDNSNV